jgi:hypothetical protein
MQTAENVTNSMEMSHSSETNNLSATQEYHILWNPKVHYRIHNSPPLVPMLGQINTVHTNPFCFSKIHFNTILHLCLGLSRGHFPFGFPTKTLYAFFSPSCVLHALPTSSFLAWSFCLAKSVSYEAPRYVVYSNLLLFHPSSVQIFPSAPFSQTPPVYVPLFRSETEFNIHTKPHVKL